MSEMTRQINQLRQKEGVPPLKPSRQMQTLARTRAAQMAAGNQPLAHERWSGLSAFGGDFKGQTPDEVRAEVIFANMIGNALELHLANEEDVARVVSQWEASPPHRAVLLDSDVTHVGAAIAKKGQKTVVVANFTNKRNATVK